MKITSLTEYATRLMVTLARAHGQAAMSAETLSELENIPTDYVNQILLKLKRAGLLQSRRGSGGGYVLSGYPKDVTLGQVVRAVEGQIFESVCEKYSGGNRDCRHQAQCSISPVWQRLAVLIEKYFDSITLEQILEEEPAGCGRAAAILNQIPSANV